MNLGLKENTGIISKSLGRITTYTNIYSNSANFIYNIPLISTLPPFPIDVSLFYNLQDHNTSTQFGYGLKLNYYKKIERNGNTISVKNADGSVDYFYLDDGYYVNKEKGLKIDFFYSLDEESGSTTYYFKIFDEVGNYQEYEEGENYPSYLFIEKEFYFFDLSEDGDIEEITNINNDKVTFTFSNSNYIVKWFKDDVELFNVVVKTRSGIFYEVEYNKHEGLTDTLVEKYSYTRNESLLKLTNEQTLERLEFSINYLNNQITAITPKINSVEVPGQKILLEYNGERTKVLQRNGNIVNTYVFDKNGFIRFVEDELGNIHTYSINKDLNKVEGQAILYNRDISNLLWGVTLNNFTGSGVSRTKITETDEYYSEKFNSSYKLSGAGTLSYSFGGTYKPGDMITLVIWAKQNFVHAPGYNTGFVQITGGKNYSNYYFNKTIVDNEYHPLVLGFKVSEQISSLKISFTFTGYFDLTIGKMELFNCGFGAFYKFDSKGNLIDQNVNGNKKEYIYNGGLLSSVNSDEGDIIDIDYTYDNKPEKITNIYGVTTQLTYDNKKRVLKEVTQNSDGSRKYEKSYQYPNDLKTISTSELGYNTTEINDNFGNVLEVINHLNQKVSSTYDSYFRLTKQVLNLVNNETALLQLDREYYSENNKKHLLKKVTCKDGTYYEFEYDAYFNLYRVKINGSDFILIGYNSTYLDVTSITYGNDSISMTYDNLGRLKTVTIDNITYTYEYDNFNNIISITDGVNNEDLIYDVDGRLKVVENDDSAFSYQYDNQDTVNLTKIDIANEVMVNDKNVSNKYIPKRAEYAIAHYWNQIDDLYAFFYNDNIALCNKSGGYLGYINGISKEEFPTSNGLLPCIAVDQNQKLSYILDCNGFVTQNVCFWWNQFEFNQDDVIAVFESFGGNKTPNEVRLRVGSGYKLYLDFYFGGILDASQCISNRLKDDEFNFIGFTIKTTQYEIYLESFVNEVKTVATIESCLDFYYLKMTFGHNCSGALAALKYRQDVDSMSNMIDYYLSTKENIIECRGIEEIEDKKNTNYLNGTQFKANNSFRQFPLHNTVKSIDGEEPFEFDIRTSIGTNRDETFKYVESMNRYCYLADGAKLIYKLDDSRTATIAMNVCLQDTLFSKRYLFECYDESYEHQLSLYANENGLLYIRINGISTSTGLSLVKNVPTFVGFTFSTASAADSANQYTTNVILRVGDQENSRTITSYVEVSVDYVSIGRLYNPEIVSSNLLNSEYLYPLNGVIDMLSINDVYSSSNTLLTLKNQSLIISKTKLDEFSMVESTSVIHNDEEVVKNSYTYKKKNGLDSNVVETEVITINNQTITRTYETDSLNRIVNIYDSVFGNDYYRYSNEGYLIQNNSKTYDFDENGDIININDISLQYTNGKLTKVGNDTLTYNGFKLSTWKGWTFDFFGKILKSMVKQGLSIFFKYNHSGLRTEKTVGSTTTKFIYEGSKLIRQTSAYFDIDFNYNEYDELIGFKYNNEQYYYVRDVLRNILGIVDTNGNLVVKYRYDAWGNHQVLDANGTVVTDASFIGNINPFRYKGYYYDVETQLFYCNSRYYSPELCRWISPDSIEYLDPESINGLNLYTYCGNNPVMGYDPNGTFDWNQFWKTALGVTAAVGLAALAVGATIATGGSFGLLAAGFAMGATASVVGQGIGNLVSGESFFNDISLSSVVMGGLAGAAFITGVGGFWGAVGIGAISNAGTSALENKSWANIGASAVVGGIAAGVGFGLGKVVSNYVFKNSGMTFIDYYELGIIDTNAVIAGVHAFASSWHTFLPSIVTSASRGATKALGNMGIGWF